jgi:hypothetical protein
MYTLFCHFLSINLRPPSRLCQTILFLIFGRSDIFVSILGFVALGLESTLPVPQLIRCVHFHYAGVLLSSIYSNYRQRSLYGFRMSTLVGWAGGDSFKQAHLPYSAIHLFMSLQGRLLFPPTFPPPIQSLRYFPAID